MSHILITALLETSDHCGYCSGSECEYNSKKVIHLLDIPKEYENCEINEINDWEEDDWLKYLQEPPLNTRGSCYCNLSEESMNAGLFRHDYRYKIIKVEIVYIV